MAKIHIENKSLVPVEPRNFRQLQRKTKSEGAITVSYDLNNSSSRACIGKQFYSFRESTRWIKLPSAINMGSISRNLFIFAASGGVTACK